MSIHRLGEKPDNKVASLIKNKPGKHSDGGGLYLQVASEGNASWVWRHKRAGDDKETWRSIGPATVYGYEKAREIAKKLRMEAHEGRDPFLLLTAGRARPVGETFGHWLTKYLDKKQGQWMASNRDRERRDHERTFDQLPEFTALYIPAITPAAKADALDKLSKSARRKATSWIEAVIRYAVTGVILQRGPGDDDEVEHHEAMPYAQVPGFYASIAGIDSDDARALRFTILTGARTDEVIGAKRGGKWTKLPATWGEIGAVDGKPTWIIPKTRYKTRKVHQVPLTPQMLALLGTRGADDDFLFKASSVNALLNTLKANGGETYTVHGFRSSFEDWAAETTNYPPDLVKRCTGHDKRSKTDKSYQRSKLLAKRREIMTAWNDFITSS
jgi:integrase